MKKWMKAVAWLALWLAGSQAGAQPSIEGTWAGQLQVAPGTSIAVHFVLSKDAAGNWAAVLNSPDNGAIKNAPATAVSFDGSKLDIEVKSLSGAYSGVLNNGTFTGEWKQPGSTLAMTLAPYVPAVLSEAAMTTLLGPWHGKLQARGVTLNIVLGFERNAAGEFSGYMQQIDTGPTKIPVSDVSLENDELFFRIPQARSEYRAKLVNGGFEGTMKQGAQDMPLNLVKGEFVAEQITLALSDADFDKLAGDWTGTLTPPGAPSSLTLIMSFKRDAGGAIAGTFKSPQQGNAELKITKATLTGSTVAVELTVPPAKFSGELSGNTITGTWSQGPQPLPLTLTKQ